MNNYLAKWFTFTKERFPLVSHLTMISLFVGAHFILARNTVSLSYSIRFVDLFLIFFAMTIFFFKMRLYDEIKDYQLDCSINPTRPLPRGLLTLLDVKKLIVICILVELFAFSFLGNKAFLTFLFAVGYSLLMYKEFFIGKYLRPHLTTYALVHTIVTIPMGLSIFSGLFDFYPWQLNCKFIYFSICSWFVFNIFEFGRKTFATEEERNQVESYSKIFGRFGSVLLVLLMSILSMFFVYKINHFISVLQLILLSLLFVIGAIYALKDNTFLGLIYRGFSSVYIVLFYLFFIAETVYGRIL